jgi:translation initiation factor 1
MSNKNKTKQGIVYSTNPDYRYEAEPDEEDTLPPSKQCLYVRKEVRNGKAVVVIKDFIGRSDDLKELEKKIKNQCGVGGTSKDHEILIQGDLKDKVKLILEKLGYKTKG